MNLQEVKFACLDTETPGLCPKDGGKICEIAVSITQNGVPVEEFSTLLNPNIPMSPAVVAIHGITNEMVAHAPTFADIAPRLLAMLEGCVLVAHNADFDLKFLQEEFSSCGLRLPNAPVLDTLKLARKSGKFAKNNLGCVAEQLGISCQGWHRAMADTKMAEQIFYYFLNRLSGQGVKTVEKLQQFQYKNWAELLSASAI